MKRKLTAEQIAKRDERRAKFKALWKQIADMPEPARIEMSNKLGIVTCEGRQLSGANMLLVAHQHPTASVVGGFRQWLKQGRAVRKGEHGSMIWCPAGNRSETPSTTPEPNPTAQEDDSDRRFIIGTVFDISQTEEVKSE